MLTDVIAAEAALERITIAEDVLDRINEFVSPGSSLIITDEAPSPETGRETDFIVVLSGEPQGGMKIRQRNPYPAYDRAHGRLPHIERNSYSWW